MVTRTTTTTRARRPAVRGRRVESAGAGSVVTTYRVAELTARRRSASCATRSNPSPVSDDLAFDLVARRITIAHTLADPAPLAAAIRGAGMGAEEVATPTPSTARRCRGGCSCTTVAAGVLAVGSEVVVIAG